jgi:hypothetical protein
MERPTSETIETITICKNGCFFVATLILSGCVWEGYGDHGGEHDIGHDGGH